MAEVLDLLGTHVGTLGNHDFDFGIENLENLVRQCHFPWLISNVKYKPTGRNLAEGETFVIKQCGGRRIGFIGIVEYEWMATLSTVEEGDVEYEDFCECTRRLSGLLREIHHVDAVVAITHMRVPNDEKLARECGDVVDLIAGGHDHHYDCKKIEPHGCYVLKSGTDFRDAPTMKMKWVDGEVVVEELER
jgi:5'-nucleotidase